MDFVGFLKILPIFVDLLAWPLFALGYPLCASIRAIETNSKTHMRKLVTYWILFSLISLFELTFVKLIEWVPFWHYIKLIAICWLIMPHFDGACYAYQCLRHPCLSMNLQVVINLLNKPNEASSLKKENFLAVAERYIQENGSEYLEKLIANKSMDTKSEHDVEEIKAVTNNEEKEVPTTIQPKMTELDIVQDDSKAVEPTVNNGAAAAKSVKIAETNLAQTEKKIGAAVEVKEMKLPAGLAASQEVQREWTCAVCQVTTQSQTTLDSHLKGRKHWARCEELKAIKQTTKKTEVKVQVTKTSEKRKQREKQKNTGAEVKNFELWCGLCNVKCPGEIDMAAHLNGRKHLSNLMM